MTRAIERLIESAPPGDGAALRARATEEGYLFFRGLVDGDAARALRRRFLAAARELGLLEPAGDPDRAIAPAGAAALAPRDATFVALQQRLLALPETDALRRDPGLLAALAALFGGEPLPGQGDVCRLLVPGPGTLPHQDGNYLQPGREIWTAWISLGDAPLDQGPLAVWPRSHQQGRLPHEQPVFGDYNALVPPPDATWASADMGLGDVVLFHRFLVHRSLENVSPDRGARLSIDLRYLAT